MGNIFQGDFGISTKTGRDIGETIFTSFKISAKLGLMAVVTAIIFGLVLGSIAALTRNRLPDRLIIFFSTLFTSLPSFVLGSLLLLVFSIKLKWVPVWSPDNQNYILPVIALAAYPMAYITRLTKTSMLDAMGQDLLVREVLGESYVAEYQKMKRREWKNYLEQVTKWELEQYLYLV